MKTFKWWQAFFVACTVALACPACGEKDEPAPDGMDPTQEVPDPTGTIQLAMRDDNNGSTRIDNLYIQDENFYGVYNQTVSLGAVKGLGNVAYIPTAGWAQRVAVVPGDGYVAYDSYYKKFYRIYVSNFISNTGGGIIGADVKYQEPFLGKDEAISLESTNLTFPATGGSQAILFNNSTIIPFEIEEANVPGTVSKASTYDQSFLTNGIAIDFTPNEQPQAITGSITLTTGYGRKTVINVTQAGREPYIYLLTNEKEVSAAAQVENIALNSNLPFDELTVSSSAQWCKAEIVDNAADLQAQNRAIKFIGDQAVSPTRSEANTSAISYTLKLTFDENETKDQRETTVMVSSKDQKISTPLHIIQKGIVFEVRTNQVGFDKNSGSRTVSINTTVSDWEAQSSADWCTFNKVGNQINIRVTSTTEERTATITFPGFDTKITVLQSKYAKDDTFSENGIEGTVCYIGDSVRYICIYAGYNATWSTENVLTGANSRTDGEYNMSMIKKIPFWQDFYPAFLLCEQLNTNGVTGWYLPAIEELTLCGLASTNYWTSTEDNESSAIRGSGISTPKQNSKTILAIHKF